MQLQKTIATIITLLSLLSMHSLAAADVVVGNLTTEYGIEPIGVDVTRPGFSWQMQGTARGYRQEAYQLAVTDEKGRKVWNTGKVRESRSLNIRYNGLALRPRTRYTWKVTVWDQLGKPHQATSWFETGLMPAADAAAWGNARWIGGNDEQLALYPGYLPVFKLNVAIRLDEPSDAVEAGVIYGANDLRLMNRNSNLSGLHNEKDSAYILVKLNIANVNTGGNAMVHLFRVGYHPDDRKDTPFASLKIPAILLNKQNRYSKHTIRLFSVLGDTKVFLDGENKENLLGTVNLNPLGRGGDFIAFPVLGDIGFYVPAGKAASFSELEIRNYRGPGNVLFAENLSATPYQGIFTPFAGKVQITNQAYRVTGGRQGAFVVVNPGRNSMPMMRTSFSATGGSIARARLYATARGIYDLFINGKRIGQDYFSPGLTQYNKTQLYQTYDVTAYVTSGSNAVGAVLGEGWWSGGATYMGEFWNFFGDRQSLLAKLVITYADGSEQVVETNPAQWKYFSDGPLRYGSLFQGEVYDAGKEAFITGWNQPGFDDAQWGPATEVTLENHISRDEANKAVNMPMTADFSGMTMVGQHEQGVRKIRVLTAVSGEEVRPGVYVYDMGQNMAGVPEIALHNTAPGTRVILRFAEVKYPDLPAYKPHAGEIMPENIRAAMAQEIYITRGGDETISPRFTYHGYRYVEITGLPAPLPPAAVKGIVLSSVPEIVSGYETSSPDVNRLWQNITWSTLANFMSIPTDCPQRNERLGWSGDISVFSRTATYLANIPGFVRKHMRAMRDVQGKDGRFSDVAPLGGGFGGVLWGSAGITVAWESYQQYGDRKLLEEHYGAMKQYIHFLEQHIDTATGVLFEEDRNKWASLGDWLSPEYDKSEKALLWEAYFIYDLQLMEKIARITGHTDDAGRLQQLCKERKAFFAGTYIDKSTGKTAFRGKTIDTQASYVLPLQFGVVDGLMKEKAASHLAAAIKRENVADDGTVCQPYSLMTGFIGTAWINEALSDNGHTAVAYRLLQNTAYPSWLYPVQQGATTIWERLNSYTREKGFGGNNRMNSFNHYSFGAVGAWMYNHSLGIQRNENEPAFKHFYLLPEPDPTGGITYAKGYYRSLYGTIFSSWEVKGKDTLYTFIIPPNTSASLLIQAQEGATVKERNTLLKNVAGVRYKGSKGGRWVFELPSGEYRIRVSK